MTISPTRHLLYIIGGPGAGKSTLLNLALADLMAVEHPGPPFRHVLYFLSDRPEHYTWEQMMDGALAGVEYTQTGYQLGALRLPFSGTDALPMNVQPIVEVELADTQHMKYPVVAEGDRLANAKFFESLMAAGYALSVVHLHVPFAVSMARRKRRSEQARVPMQDEAWAKGRFTKVENLARSYAHLTLDGTEPLPHLVEQLRQHRVIRMLHGETP